MYGALMSIKLMTAVWALDLPSSEKFVLLSLADNANDDGVCWPSITNVASKTSLSRKTVQRAIRTLTEIHALAISERFGRSHSYSITLDTMTPHPGHGDTPLRGDPGHGDPPTQVMVTPTQVTMTQDPGHGDTLNHQRTIKEPSLESEEARPPRAKRSTGTRIPDDFLLTQARIEYAEGKGVDPEETFEDFADYWRAKSGAAAVKCDWDATWRRWCRTASRPRGGPRPPARRPKTTAELEAEEAARNAQH